MAGVTDARARRARSTPPTRSRASASASCWATRSGIYLDGNSLGRLPVATRERLHARVDEWGDRLVDGLAGLDRRADARRRRARAR